MRTALALLIAALLVVLGASAAAIRIAGIEITEEFRRDDDAIAA